MFRFALRRLSPLALLVGIAGCGTQETTQDQQVQQVPKEHNGDEGDHASSGHSHKALHGGQVQAVGNNHFELVYDAAAGGFTLYVLGSEETESEPIAEKEIPLQVRNEATGEYKKLTLAAEPLEGESDDKSSRFSATNADLAKLGNLEAVARIPVAGEPYRVAFQFVDGKPISESLKPQHDDHEEQKDHKVHDDQKENKDHKHNE